MNYESSSIVGDGGNERRVAAHVKWDGKTIALGTFSVREAAEKCNRAKALTKEWRETMVPKPNVDWVKATLEKLHIRAVNDRPGRRKKRDISELAADKQSLKPLTSSQRKTSMNKPVNFQASSNSLFRSEGAFQSSDRVHGPSLSLLSSHGFSDGSQVYRRNSLSIGILPNSCYDNNSNSMQSFERISPIECHHDQLQCESTRRGYGSSNKQHQLSNLVFGSSQHYTVLKEHHMNLLKELQETTAMMNMYHNSNSHQGMIQNNTIQATNHESLDSVHNINDNMFN